MIIQNLHRQPVAVDRNEHRFVRLKVPITDWSLAAKLNTMFVAATELGDAAREFPIVFVNAGNGEDGLPVRVERIADVGRFRIVDARAGEQLIKVLVGEGKAVPEGEAHLAFNPQRTNVYADGWIVE